MSKKAIIISLVACCAIAIIWFSSNKKIQEMMIVRSFESRQESFEAIAKYLNESPSKIVIEGKPNKSYTVTSVGKGENTKLKITEPKILKSIKEVMLKEGFDHIDEEGNAIYFIKNTDIHFEQGIAYSKDSKKPDWPRIYKLESLKSGWFYYESE